MTLAASKNEALPDTDTIEVAAALLEQGMQAYSIEAASEGKTL